MGFFDTLKNLTHPYPANEDDYMDDAELVDEPEPESEPESEPEQKPRPNPFSGFRTAPAQPAASAASAAPQVRPLRPKEGKVVNLGGQSQVVVFKPESMQAAPAIADQLRAKHAVLLNIETTAKDVAIRLVDFLCGVAYAMDGNIRKVAANTYLITPPNVNIVGDKMEDLDSSSVYF